METPDKPTTFVDLLAEEGAYDEQIALVKKRLLIPLGVLFVLAIARWAGVLHGPSAPSSDLRDPAVPVGNLAPLN